MWAAYSAHGSESLSCTSYSRLNHRQSSSRKRSPNYSINLVEEYSGRNVIRQRNISHDGRSLDRSKSRTIEPDTAVQVDMEQAACRGDERATLTRACRHTLSNSVAL